MKVWNERGFASERKQVCCHGQPPEVEFPVPAGVRFACFGPSKFDEQLEITVFSRLAMQGRGFIVVETRKFNHPAPTLQRIRLHQAGLLEAARMHDSPMWVHRSDSSYAEVTDTGQAPPKVESKM